MCRAAIARLDVTDRHFASDFLVANQSWPDIAALGANRHWQHLIVASASALAGVGVWAAAVTALCSPRVETAAIVGRLLEAARTHRRIASVLDPRQRAARVAVLKCMQSCNAAATMLYRLARNAQQIDEWELRVESARTCLIAAQEATSFALQCLRNEFIFQLSSPGTRFVKGQGYAAQWQTEHNYSGASSHRDVKERQRLALGSSEASGSRGVSEDEELVAALRTFAALCARAAARAAHIRERGAGALSLVEPAARELFGIALARLPLRHGPRLDSKERNYAVWATALLGTFNTLVEHVARHCLFRRVAVAACERLGSERNGTVPHEVEKLAEAVLNLLAGGSASGSAAASELLRPSLILQTFDCLTSDSAVSALAAAFLLFLPSSLLRPDRALWRIISQRRTGNSRRWLAFQLWLSRWHVQPH